MNKIKSLDAINGLDLTAIAYAIAVIVGLCSRIDLTITMLITSLFCSVMCVKLRKISLSILNISICLYVFGELWNHHLVELIDQGIDSIKNCFDEFSLVGFLMQLLKK